MSKIAILFSGHLRNVNEIIYNLKNNFLDIINQDYNYDIYIHSWDNNISNDKYLNNDKFFNNKITNIKKVFEKNNIIIKNILIENQEKIAKDVNIQKYINETYKSKFFYGNDDKKKNLIEKLFWQFYGHKAVLNLINKKELINYKIIIKTRPDMFYDKFDLSILKNDIFFPNSHLYNGKCINQLFFGGKTEYMIKILNYFGKIIYYKKKCNIKFIKNLNLKNLSFNSIFKNYIFDYLKYKPEFISYDPRLYRNKDLIVKISK